MPGATLSQSLSTDFAPARQSPHSCLRAFVLAGASIWNTLPPDLDLTCAPSSITCTFLEKLSLTTQAAQPRFPLLY